MLVCNPVGSHEVIAPRGAGLLCPENILISREEAERGTRNTDFRGLKADGFVPGSSSIQL